MQRDLVLRARTGDHEAFGDRPRRLLEIQVDGIDPAGDPGDGRELSARDQVDRGFRRLTAEQRAVLVVHHYLGLPDAEAADVLGIPAGTLRRYAHAPAPAPDPVMVRRVPTRPSGCTARTAPSPA